MTDPTSHPDPASGAERLAAPSASKARDEILSDAPREPILDPHEGRSDLRILMAVSAPIMVATTSRAVMQFVDFAMVSQLPRATEAQAAVGASGVTLFVLIGFWIGVMTCVNTFASQSLGRNQPHDCGAYAWQSIYVSLAAGMLAMPLLPLVRPLFVYFAHGEGVIDYETDYMQVGLFSVGAFTLQVALSNFFNGVHKPGVVATSAVGANLFNVVANYLLIFGNPTLGIPTLEVKGAALGTLLSALFRSVWLITAMLGPYYADRFGTRTMWRPDWSKVNDFLRIGLPAGLQFAFDVMAWSLFMMWLVGRFGPEHLAASNIAWQWCHLIFMPALGIGIGLTAVVGKAIGEERYDKARRRARIALGLVGTYMGTCGLITIVFRWSLAGLLADNPEVLGIAVQLMICGGLFQFFDGMQLVYNSALRGAGDTLWTAVVLVTTCWVVLVGGGVTLSYAMPQLGALGPWIAATSYVTLLGFILATRWWRGKWELIDIFSSAGSTGRAGLTDAMGDVAETQMTDDTDQEASSVAHQVEVKHGK